MKTKIIPLLAWLLATTAAWADTAGAVPPCCANCTAEAAPAAFSSRSLYQLEGKWTDDSGRTVTLASLRGRPVVLAMFFSNCTYACPLIVHDMRDARDALPPAVRAQTRFVLVSFDTERDTPAALRAYRERMQLDPDAWILLRGSPADVQELAMVLGVKYKKDADGQFAHSNLITVLNREGEIAFQRSGLQDGIAETVHAVTLAAR
ncbi:MAG TPA: SCO family protein [Opitutaceae bacterium]|nr:SCO family protein [Opitutaceae bacterium]